MTMKKYIKPETAITEIATQQMIAQSPLDGSKLGGDGTEIDAPETILGKGDDAPGFWEDEAEE